MATRQYAKYYPQQFPSNNAPTFRAREQKLITTAQAGIADEKTLLQAIAAACDNDLIVLAPTTITLTAQLSISRPLRFKGSSAAGTSGTKITGALSGALISIVQTSGEITFENISFVQGTDDVDVIAYNNTGATATGTVKFIGCNISVFDAAANGFAINVSHGVAGQAVQLIVTGDGTQTCDSINFTVKNAADLVEIHSMKMQAQGKASACVCSADALAAKVQFYNCEVPHEKGASGGNAAQLLLSMHTWSRTSTTYAAADANDFIGSQTATIV